MVGQNRPVTTDATPEPLSLAGTGDHSVGVLLVHGFSGSAASMKPWARFLAERGYAVEVPLLPGHGTRWQDLNTVSWSQWYDEAEAALDRLLTTHKKVVVCALSMGGSVALRLAQTRGDEVAGVVLVNPFVSSARIELKALPLLKHLVPSFPGIVDDIKKPDQVELGYPRLPLKGVAQILAMWKTVVPALGQVTQPVLYFRSTIDHVIDASSSATVLSGISSVDVEERMLEDSYHVATIDNDAPRIFEESLEFIQRVSP